MFSRQRPGAGAHRLDLDDGESTPAAIPADSTATLMATTALATTASSTTAADAAAPLPTAKVLRMMGLTAAEYTAMKQREAAGALATDLAAAHAARAATAPCHDCAAPLHHHALVCWDCSGARAPLLVPRARCDPWDPAFGASVATLAPPARVWLCRPCAAARPHRGHLCSPEPLEPAAASS